MRVTIHTTRYEAEAQIPVAVSAPKELGAISPTCRSGGGAEGPHRKASGCTARPRKSCVT